VIVSQVFSVRVTLFFKWFRAKIQPNDNGVHQFAGFSVNNLTVEEQQYGTVAKSGPTGMKE
jgi:hypothetical protein